jgi:hypothetical protein
MPSLFFDTHSRLRTIHHHSAQHARQVINDRIVTETRIPTPKTILPAQRMQDLLVPALDYDAGGR